MLINLSYHTLHPSTYLPYNWKFVHFYCLHPFLLAPPPPASHDCSFMNLFVLESIIDLQYYSLVQMETRLMETRLDHLKCTEISIHYVVIWLYIPILIRRG